MPYETTNDAVDDMNGKARSALLGAGIPETSILWDNIESLPPVSPPGNPNPAQHPAADFWAAVAVIHVDEGVATLGSVNNRRRFESRGMLVIRLFVPASGGWHNAYVVKDQVLDVFRSAGNGAGGVSFSSPRAQEESDKGAWRILACMVDFTYDRIV